MNKVVCGIAGVLVGGVTGYMYSEYKKHNLERNPEDILEEYEDLDLPEVEPVKPEDIGDPEVQKTLKDWDEEQKAKSEGVDYD